MSVIEYIETAMIIALISLSLATVEAIKLRRAVVYLGAFSLLSSFVFLLYNAPDVAIAEAVIGCTISVILFLTALKKYRIITIYYVQNHENDPLSLQAQEFCNVLITDLEKFLIEDEFEPQLVVTSLHDETLHDQEDFDLLVVNSGDLISIYSGKENYHTPLIGNYINNYPQQDFFVEFIPLMEDTDYEG